MKLTVGFWICMAGIAVQAAELPLSLTISAENTIVHADEVNVTASLANMTDQAILLQGGGADVNYLLDVTDGTGKPAPESAYARRLKHSVRIVGHTTPLGAGKSLSITIDIAKFFDLAASATYTIQLRRSLEPYLGGGALASNTVTITTLPSSKPAGDQSPDSLGTTPGAPNSVPTPSSGPAKDSFTLRIELDRATFTQGKEIPVYAFLTNTSARQITVPSPGSWDSDYGVEARDEHGIIAPYTMGGRERSEQATRVGDRKPSLLTVPGHSFSGQIEIDKRVEMTVPGTYRVQLWWPVPGELGGGEIRSNVITIVIAPRTAEK